jgi:hypothetical protein
MQRLRIHGAISPLPIRLHGVVLNFATQHSNQEGKEAIGLITERNMGKGEKEIKVRQRKRKEIIVVVEFQMVFFFPLVKQYCF